MVPNLIRKLTDQLIDDARKGVCFSMGLADKLAFLSSGNPDGLDNPMYEESDSSTTSEPVPRSNLSDDDSSHEEVFSEILGDDSFGRKGKKHKKKDFFADLVEKHDTLTNFSSDILADSLDGYLDELDEFDSELRDSLISLGRKYHRDTSTTAKSSEISKTYAAAEKRYRALYKEIDDDKVSIQKDIDQMRLARTRNFKALSDLIEAKNTQHNLQVSILEKINRMRKDEYELHMKEAAQAKENGEGANEVNGSAIRSLFSLGRSDMVSAMGGYEGISGAVTEDKDGNPVYQGYEDSPEAHGLEFDEDTDGDRFLQFEDCHPEWILLIDEDENVQGVIAEGSDGEILPDYPIPDNLNELNFNINKKLGTATDDYHRTYKVRVV